jgi:F-type H+-transporting ATPase subunit b
VQIDGVTFIAQIINFLILVGLLRYFLYDPVVNAMDEREAKIAARLEEADEKQKTAEKEAKTYRQKRREIEAKRKELIDQAREEADKKRHDLIDEAREAVEQKRKKWRASIEHEKQTFINELRQRATHQIVEVARRALADLADADLEQRIINEFARRVQALGDEEKTEIIQAVQDAGGVVIASAFELPDETRERLNEIVRAHIGEHTKLSFRSEPDLIGGVTLRTNGYEIGWSLRSYLHLLDERMIEALADVEEQEESEGT